MTIGGRGVYLFGFTIPIFVGPSALTFDEDHIGLRLRVVGHTPLALDRTSVAAVRRGARGGGLVFFERAPAGMHRWGIKPYWSHGGAAELLSQLDALGWPVDDSYLKMSQVTAMLRAPDLPPPPGGEA